MSVQLLDFGAKWCGPCRALIPVIADLQKLVPALKIVKVDVDDNQALAAEYEVYSLPTLVFVYGGKREVVHNLSLNFLVKRAKELLKLSH